MNALQKINIIALSIPFFVYLIGVIIREDLLIIALLSTMITGLMQLVIGLKLLENYSSHPLLQLYFVTVLLFFILWFTTYWDFLWVLPLALAIYMTCILHLINPKN